MRDSTEKVKTLPRQTPASVNINVVPEAPKSNGPVASSSLAILKPEPSSGSVQRFLDKAADEGFVIIYSPKVII